MNLLRSWLLVFVQALNLWLPFVLGSSAPLCTRLPASRETSGLPPYSWDHTGLVESVE